jgi:hypothetical protein
MKRALLGAVAGVVLLVVATTMTLSWQRHESAARTVTDVSWPNCKVKSVATAAGIVGVTGGLDFAPNKCVRGEVSWFPSAALYMNSGWPGVEFHLQYPSSPLVCGAGDNDCLAYNYGFNAALYAIHYANNQLTTSSQWWLDVETDNSWTTNSEQNQSALLGMAAALEQNVFKAQVGFYSSPQQWAQIVGVWRPKVSVWLATGSQSSSVARQACHEPSFTSGPVVLVQYTPHLDENYLC